MEHDVQSVQHVAIIMDGNRRWAEKNQQLTIQGHQEGAKAARKATEYAIKAQIPYLTLYAFSSENWGRDPEWISDFMTLLRFYITTEITTLKKEGVQLRLIGDITRFPKDIQVLLHDAIQETRNNNRLYLTLALGYGGRAEILRALNRMLEAHPQKSSSNSLGESLSEANLSQFLDTQNIPDPDILIRTGGDHRISNFLLWQIAYTELFFLDCLWPDFGEQEFHDVIQNFQKRSRRFGRYHVS